MVNPLLNPVLNSTKQERKKKYADLAVQNTNNSSIASKRSVESIYLSKLFELNNKQNIEGTEDFNNDKFLEYFKFFVPKLINRSPCINRGYWLRLHAIRSRLDSILTMALNLNPASKLAIINLGCGFDPLPFQLLDKRNNTTTNYHNNIFYLDVDYKDLLMNKIEVINTNVELSNIVGENITLDGKDLQSNYTTTNYFARPCNLNDSNAFDKLINKSTDDLPFLYDNNVTKIFIAEVSLAYMKFELSDKIIELTSTLPNSHFIILEQLIPQGPMEPFSKQMLKHFTKNDSPLQTVIQYQDIASQIERFSKLGYQNCNAGDMLQLWNNVDLTTKRLIESIQPFDELEEFHLFCHHYILLHATNNDNFEFVEPYLFKDTNHLTTITQTEKLNKDNEKIYKLYPHFQIKSLPVNLKRNFGSSSKVNDKLIYFGGCTPYRVNDVLVIDPITNAIETANKKIDSKTKLGPIIPARTCHTMNNISNDEFIIIGGRNAPHKPFNDIWYFNFKLNQWENKFYLPQSRFRHCSEIISNNQILIYGGNNNDISAKLEPFLVYNWEMNQFEDVIVTKKPIDCLVSSGMVYHSPTNKLVILGGQDRTNDSISNKLIVSNIEYDQNEITIETINEFTDPLFQRYGSKIKFIDDDHIVVVGGTSSSGLFNQNTTIIIVNISTGDITNVPIPQDIWENESLMFVGFDLEFDSIRRELIILGGAATCYGFGLVNNTSISITL